MRNHSTPGGFRNKYLVSHGCGGWKHEISTLGGSGPTDSCVGESVPCHSQLLVVSVDPGCPLAFAAPPDLCPHPHILFPSVCVSVSKFPF